MIYEVAANTWKEALSIYNLICQKNPIWAFRGQSNNKWPLSTKFEREGKKHQLNPYFYRTCEKNIIREFMRQASQYISVLPAKDDTIDWLSLIQHFGGPTRLLDFSYSFYVAAFFATINSETDSIIWCINVNSLIEKNEFFSEQLNHIGYHNTVQNCVEFANKVLASNQFDKKSKLNQISSVCVVEPFVQQQRLGIQQGFFLFPTNIEESFEFNLIRSLSIEGKNLEKSLFKKIKRSELNKINGDSLSILKLLLSKEMKYEVSNQLRSMNITDATLFPGIDGFARSLQYNFHDIKWSILRPRK
jgi:hypothetical protein